MVEFGVKSGVGWGYWWNFNIAFMSLVTRMMAAKELLAYIDLFVLKLSNLRLLRL